VRRRVPASYAAIATERSRLPTSHCPREDETSQKLTLTNGGPPSIDIFTSTTTLRIRTITRIQRPLRLSYATVSRRKRAATQYTTSLSNSQNTIPQVVIYDGKWQGSGNDETNCEVLPARISHLLFSKVSFPSHAPGGCIHNRTGERGEHTSLHALLRGRGRHTKKAQR
jgi:hypothetical protein